MQCWMGTSNCGGGHVSMSGLEGMLASISFCSCVNLGTSVLVCHTKTCGEGGGRGKRSVERGSGV